MSYPISGSEPSKNLGFGKGDQLRKKSGQAKDMPSQEEIIHAVQEEATHKTKGRSKSVNISKLAVSAPEKEKNQKTEKFLAEVKEKGAQKDKEKNYTEEGEKELEREDSSGEEEDREFSSQQPKSDPARKLFLDEIRKGATARGIRQLGKELERTLSDPKELFNLKLLGASQNPVSRVPKVSFIPVGDLQAISKSKIPPPTPSWGAVNQLMRDEYKNLPKKNEIIDDYKELYKLVEKIYKYKISETKKFQMVMDILNKYVQSLESSEHKDVFLNLKKKLMDAQQGLIDAQNTRASPPVYYSKEDLLSKLKALRYYTEHLEAEPEFQAQKNVEGTENLSLSQINALITEMALFPNFIKKQDLAEFLRVNNISHIQKPLMTNITGYYSSLDLAQEYDLEAINSLSSIKYSGETGFVVKSGSENIREILGQGLLSSLDLGSYVVTKSEANIPRIKMGHIPSPEDLIGGPWLEGGRKLQDDNMEKFLINQGFLKERSERLAGLQKCLQTLDSRSKWGEIELEILKRHYINLNSPDIKEQLQQQIRIANKKIAPISRETLELEKSIEEDLGILGNEVAKAEFKEVMREHALIDLLFCSFDSHQQQYIVKDHIPFCVDFARYFPPSLIYTRTNETRVAFRSYFLDQPACFEQMSTTMKDKILSWDVAQLEASYRANGLIGNRDEFKEKGEQMRRILSLVDRLHQIQYKVQNPKLQIQAFSELDKLCKEIEEKFGVTLPGKNLPEKGNAIGPFLEKEREKITSTTFDKIHPQAFEEFKTRILHLQMYVQTEQAPTMQGAFSHLYSRLEPFIRVSRHWRIQPSFNINLRKNPNTQRIESHSLEELISEAKNPRNGATPNEIKELEEALERIKSDQSDSKPVDSTELSLTMSLH